MFIYLYFPISDHYKPYIFPLSFVLHFFFIFLIFLQAMLFHSIQPYIDSLHLDRTFHFLFVFHVHFTELDRLNGTSSHFLPFQLLLISQDLMPIEIKLEQ